ncbi:hypothetical protein A4X20_09880 [Mycolicibacterium iranicum]|uniref:Uncharacterized protein n=1 Tax=Mycolicibacterium iranicum TaxID=912594 RepID=A0A178LHK2_MYCIR|nr:hypothetical protein A4X20_09880 [Mycolicibacterium iranicum]
MQSVLIEYSVVFELSGGFFIVIESAIRFERGNSARNLFAEEDPDEDLQPLRELVGSIIDEAAVDPAGALRVGFSDGTRLQVEPDDAYEAWNVSGPDGALIVCTPGGALVTWSKNN